MSSDARIFDTGLLDVRFRRAVQDLVGYDYLLRRVAEDFADRLGLMKHDFSRALDVGRYAGYLAQHLAPIPAIGTFEVAGPCGKLTEQTPTEPIFSRRDANEEALTLGSGSFDLILSGLSLQLVNDVPGALRAMRDALKPDGLFLAAILGGETLKELRQSWLVAEEEITGGVSPRVAPFADVRDLGRLLQRAGFALPVADSDIVRVTFASPLVLMHELKAMGASNALLLRRRVPVTRRLILRAAEIYSERFALADGRIPATFEIITLTAWAPHESQQKPLAPGSAQVRLEDALGAKRSEDPDEL